VRERQLHYRGIASDLILLINEYFADDRPVVLHYGCGAALEAQRVAERCARLWLADASTPVVDGLRGRFAASASIAVLTADAVTTLNAGSIDLIVVSAVSETLSRAQLEAKVAIWRGKLTARGWLVLADIIAPGGSGLGAAIAGLFRRRRDVAHYSEEQMWQILNDANFNAQRRRSNPGDNAARFCFAARWR
jgi:Methyltransferase domain